METTHAGFAERLQEALAAAGIAEEAAKVRAVAQAGTVSASTARRYLAGKSRPRHFDGLQALADGLNVDSEWLYNGSERQQWATLFERLTPWQRNRFRRLCIRLRNDDAKAERLVGMVNAGQLPLDAMLARV